MKKIIVLIFILFFLAACSKSNNTQLEIKPLTVNIQNFAFSPSEITINSGDTVTWINNDDAPHTITGDSFDSGTISNGQEFKNTFQEKGTYEYHCNFHSSMKGKVIVE